MFKSKVPTHKAASKSDAPKKTSSRSQPISRTICLGFLLGVVAITAIVREFEGRIEIKMGLEGSEFLIDGRKSPSPPAITNNPSSNDSNSP
jgi:hypothetical protein